MRLLNAPESDEFTLWVEMCNSGDAVIKNTGTISSITGVFSDNTMYSTTRYSKGIIANNENASPLLYNTIISKS